MLDILRTDLEDLKEKINKINKRLYRSAQVTNVASNDVIKTIALSNEIADDVKEVLIILQTTMATEFTDAKSSTYKANSDILEAVNDVIRIQTKLINNLAKLDKSKSEVKKTKIQHGLVYIYRKPLSIIMVLVVAWGMAVLNPDALDKIASWGSAILKGGLGVK